MNKKGFGFVIINGIDDFYVNEVNLNWALHGDEVLIEVFFNYHEGKIDSYVYIPPQRR